MPYKAILICFIIFLLWVQPATAQDKYYRIEILVLTHLRHDSEPMDVEELTDFSEALDFLIVPDPEEDIEGEADEEETDLTLVDDPDLLPDAELEADPDAALAPEEPEPWSEVFAIEERSDIMNEAWRRLRLSAPFRPQQYLSWVQSADEPFPLLRMHNQEVVLEIDPYAEERAERALLAEELAEEALANQKQPPAVFNDQGDELPEEADVEPELPDPTRYFELDGTVQLVRSRFLHLEFDLEMREALFEPVDFGELTPVPIHLSVDGDEGEEQPRPSSFLVFDLQQQRQVRSERMEYFDGPVVSALAYITEFDMEQYLEDQAVEDEFEGSE